MKNDFVRHFKRDPSVQVETIIRIAAAISAILIMITVHNVLIDLG